MTRCKRTRKKRLTALQKRWCDAMVGEAHGNKARAAQIAGYQAGSRESFSSIGHKLSRQGHVAEHLAKLQEEFEAASGPSARDVKDYLSDVMSGTSGVPLLDAKGNAVLDAQGFPVMITIQRDRLRAAELLLRCMGAFAPEKHQHEVHSTGGMLVLPAPLSDDEWARRFSKGKVIDAEDLEKGRVV